jgi:hypothetical protein
MKLKNLQNKTDEINFTVVNNDGKKQDFTIVNENSQDLDFYANGSLIGTKTIDKETIIDKLNFLLDSKRFKIYGSTLVYIGGKRNFDIAYLYPSSNSIDIVSGNNIQMNFDNLKYFCFNDGLISIIPSDLNEFCKRFNTNLDCSFDIG